MLKTDVLKYFGTGVAAAKALNITPAAVSEWGEIIPKGRAYELQALTLGDLRVDLALYETGTSVDA